MFITELPADKYGNRGYTPRQPEVIEVETIEPDRVRVIAPDSFREKWPTLRASGWKEVSGPARLLTQAEYEALISS